MRSGTNRRAPSDEPREPVEHVVDREKRVGQHDALGRRVRDVALVPERDVLEPDRRVPADEAREPADALGDDRDCACAASPTSPSGPAANGSSTSRTSVRARCRISSAKRSSDDARSASAERSSAWRSRWRICVELGAGSRPSRLARDPLDLRSRRAYVPTAPESFPTRIPASARSSRLAVALELERPAEQLEPERRRLGVHPVRTADRDRVAMLLGARQRPPSIARSMPSRTSSPARWIAERERSVDDVRRRKPVVKPASVRAEVRRDRVDERGDVVVGDALELGDAAPGSARARARGPHARSRTGRLRPRPRHRGLRAPRPASARASPPPTRPWTSQVWRSGRSPTRF